MTIHGSTINESGLRKRLSEAGQEHLLRFWDELNSDQRALLANDIAAIDFEHCHRVFGQVSRAESVVSEETCSTPDSLPADPSPEIESLYAEATKLGQQLVSEGKVAAMVVAGGQATRLGFDAPKGAFPIAPISGKALFQLFAESILGTERRFGGVIPFYVMTSAANHEETVAFFTEYNWFGLNQGNVRFFSQGMMPVVDESGRVLLDQKHRVALAPNGHGGSLIALVESGMLKDMAQRGVEQISYFQVDNPLVRPVDPRFLGLHVLQESEMSSLTIGKADDHEKVGLFVRIDGELRVVEYTSFPAELATMRNSDGSRKYDHANIAVHIVDRVFVERIVGDGHDTLLPWHKALKKVEHVDLETGNRVSPDEPNAFKSEMFVFDALRFAKRPMLLQTKRELHFSPVKNPDGVDSVHSARRDMERRAARWLESCGSTVPRKSNGELDCKLEISPLYAIDEENLRERESAPREIKPGETVLIE